jgi:hypothetical protein
MQLAAARQAILSCSQSRVNVYICVPGLLWGGEHYMYDSSVPPEVKEKVTKWTALAQKFGLTLPQVAMNFAFL